MLLFPLGNISKTLESRVSLENLCEDSHRPPPAAQHNTRIAKSYQIIEGEPKTTLGPPRHSPGTAPDIPGTTPARPKIDDELPAGWPGPGQVGRPKRVSVDAAAPKIERADAA